jgi:hypothetical protein
VRVLGVPSEWCGGLAVLCVCALRVRVRVLCRWAVIFVCDCACRARATNEAGRSAAVFIVLLWRGMRF